MIIDVIIPVFNESDSIRHVVRDVPRSWMLEGEECVVRDIIVVDNDSTDDSARVAADSGAVVISEKTRGYGSACLKGMAHIAARPESQQPDTVVFLDGDYSDYPEEMPNLVGPLKAGYDMVIGSRALGQRERGSMAPQQVFGNWLATNLIRLFYKVEFSDLGPFRAISYPKLLELGMVDRNYGWTVEMQVKAAKRGFRCIDVPVNYRKRIGVSKVTGTVKGTIMAGYKIITTIFRYI